MGSHYFLSKLGVVSIFTQLAFVSQVREDWYSTTRRFRRSFTHIIFGKQECTGSRSLPVAGMQCCCSSLTIWEDRAWLHSKYLSKMTSKSRDQSSPTFLVRFWPFSWVLAFHQGQIWYLGFAPSRPSVCRLCFLFPILSSFIFIFSASKRYGLNKALTCIGTHVVLWLLVLRSQCVPLPRRQRWSTNWNFRIYFFSSVSSSGYVGNAKRLEMQNVHQRCLFVTVEFSLLTQTRSLSLWEIEHPTSLPGYHCSAAFPFFVSSLVCCHGWFGILLPRTHVGGQDVVRKSIGKEYLVWLFPKIRRDLLAAWKWVNYVAYVVQFECCRRPKECST